MIKLEHVSKSYSAGIPALNDVSLNIEEGEFVFDGSAAVVTCGGSQPDGRSVELTGKTPLKLNLKVEDLRW